MPQRPNILIITSDQQRRDTMACYGNDWIDTPALNQLAERSFVFENAYVAQPVCSPARAALLTGLYPHSAGVVRNSEPGRPFSNLFPEVQTIAELLPDEYHCAKLGKWHLGNDLFAQHGFDEWLSTEDAHDDNHPTATRPEDLGRHSDYHQYMVEQGYKPEGIDEPTGYRSFTQHQRGFLPLEHTVAMYLGRKAGEFIHRQSGEDRPWLLHVSLFEPHPPYNGPFNDMYTPESIPDGPLFLKRPAENTPLFNRLRSDHHIAEAIEVQPDNPESYWRALRARYYGNVSVLDRGIGLILDALDESGIVDNTIVVFTSDHGDSLGDRGMLNKRAFYDEVARVPLLISGPDINGAGRKIEGNFGHVDLVPTLLDLVDEVPPEVLQGQSQAGVLRSDTELQGDVFMQWHGGPATVPLGNKAVERMSVLPWRTVVTQDRWKLNLCPGDQCELYDLNNDPLELDNLFDHPGYRDRVRDLSARISDWQYRTGDDLVLPAV